MSLASDPIVIFGAPRSGTTFLNELLNAHPLVHVTHEMRVFVWAHQALQDWARKDRFLVTHREEFVEFTRGRLAATIRDFYAHKWPEIVYWGDKNPLYGDYTNRGCLDTIRLLFPAARFVHIIRDGRDVVTSLVRRKHADGRSWADVEQAAWTWRDTVAIGAAFGRKLGPDGYLSLRYEDLVRDGLAHARDLLRFLGIPMHPAVEDFCLREQQQRSAFSTPTRNLGTDDALRSDWATALDAADREAAMAILEPTLVELGYLARPEARS